MIRINYKFEFYKHINMIPNLLESYRQMLEGLGLSSNLALFIENSTVFVLIILLAFLSDKLTKGILVRVIGKIVKSSKNKFDDIFFQRRVFQRLAHIAPALVINATIVFLIDPGTLAEGETAGSVFSAANIVNVIRACSKLYIVLIAALVADSMITSFHDIYITLPVSKGRNIKGYVQLVKILVYIIAVLISVSIITNKPISGLLTGVGAFAAVLILVFRDTILGLVASIQLAGNKMVSVGDWISMPQFHADGDVIDISLNTVKVQNWDKTISTIPTYALVSNSFNNWKGMEESGGRRIKRSIFIDVNSVKFADKEMIEKYRKIRILKPYIEGKLDEIARFNKEKGLDKEAPVNTRRITNLGTFRKYLENYLREHPMIHNEMTFLVRHLQPTEKGLPIEIYVFSKDQKWANYEAIQADIFDHVLAVVPEFDLKLFQNPSGSDFAAAINK